MEDMNILQPSEWNIKQNDSPVTPPPNPGNNITQTNENQFVTYTAYNIGTENNMQIMLTAE
jgi:hypothetical protein